MSFGWQPHYVTTNLNPTTTFRMSSANIQEKEAKKIRQRKGIVRPVKAPLGGMSFKLYIYILAAVTLAWAVYYAYRM